MTEDPVLASLEAVAQRCEDPTPLVYARLFAANPDMEALFVMDRNDSVKGQMLSQAFDCILDFRAERAYGGQMIAAEIVNHEGMGVPPETFQTFFTTIMETFREILADDWTSAMDAAWAELLADLAAVMQGADAPAAA